MRLKAWLLNPQLFSQMINTLDGLSKTLILRFTREMVYFIVVSGAQDGNLKLWGQIQAKMIFTADGYTVESVAGNEIWLELLSEHLAQALKSCSKDNQLKLTKKDGQPVLSLLVHGAQSLGGKEVVLLQDVPVRVLSLQQQEELLEPNLPPHDATIMLPHDLSQLKVVCDRMRLVSNSLTVSANMSGCMQLQASSSKMTVQTTMRNLVNPELDMPQESLSIQPSLIRDPQQMASVQVDSRAFAKVMQTHGIKPNHVVCCIIESVGVLLYAYVGNLPEGCAASASTSMDYYYGAFVYFLQAKRQEVP